MIESKFRSMTRLGEGFLGCWISRLMFSDGVIIQTIIRAVQNMSSSNTSCLQNYEVNLGRYENFHIFMSMGPCLKV